MNIAVRILVLMIVVFLAGFLSWQYNYVPIIKNKAEWENSLKELREYRNKVEDIKNRFNEVQNILNKYDELKKVLQVSTSSNRKQGFISFTLKNIEKIINEVREQTKDKNFKLSNINFGSIGSRTIGGSENTPGISIKSTEITMSLTGKYSTIIYFLRQLADQNKVGSLVRIKTVSFSPSKVEVGKSPVLSASLTLETIEIQGR
jgi:Tfp pilus assembly protein PilO